MKKYFESLFDAPLRALFGRDVFISYARRDAIGYVRQLAAAIRVRRPPVSICIDQWAAPPYATTHPALLRELRRSSLLVLVASDSAVHSANVAVELLEFGPSGRNILPIDVGGALERSSWSPAVLETLRGTVTERETPSALAIGEPSPAVVERIVEAIDFETQTERIRQFARRTVAGVLLMVVVAIAFSSWRIADADRQREAAKEEASAAMSTAAGARRSEAEARGLEANARQRADQQSERANTESQRAEAEQQRAAEAAAEANLQQEVALALRLANESATVLRQQPEHIGRATLLAAVAAERLIRRGVRSLSVESALREAAGLLPIVDRATAIPTGNSDTLALSPDGRYLAVIRDDSMVELCTTQTAGCTRLEHSIDLSADSFHELVFSSDSRAVGASFETLEGGYSVLVWMTETGRLQGSPVELPAESFGITLAPGGEWLAVGTPEGVAILRLRDRSDLVRTLPVPAGIPTGWSSTAEPLLLTTGSDVRLWSPDIAEPLAVLTTRSELMDATLSPDGSTVATTDETRELAVWDWRRSPRQPSWTLRAASALSTVKFSPDGALLATAETEEGTRVFETATGRSIGFFEGGTHFAFSTDNSLFLTSVTGAARLWRLADGQELARQPAIAEPEVAFLADGRAVSGEGIQPFVTWHGNPATRPESPLDLSGRIGEVMPIPASNDVLVSAFASAQATTTLYRVSPDGKSRPCLSTPGEVQILLPLEGGGVLTTNKKGNIRTWEAPCAGGTRPSYEADLEKPILALAWGANIAVAVDGQTFLKYQDDLQTLPHPKAVHGLVFSANGRALFTNADGQIREWDVASRPPRIIRSLVGHRGSARLILDRSGRYLATSGIITGAEIWDLHRNDQKPVCVLRPDWTDNIVKFDPSGRYLLTGGADRILTLWTGWEKGQPQAFFRMKLASKIRDALFSDDGNTLVAIGDDPPTMLRALWRPEDLLRIACQAGRSSFSRNEWHYMLPGVPYQPPCPSGSN